MWSPSTSPTRALSPTSSRSSPRTSCRLVSERENIGPGSSADLQVAIGRGHLLLRLQAQHGGNLVGSTQLTVTPGESVELSADDKEAEEQAVTNYTSYVKDQAGQLKTATEEFTQAYVSGDTEKAKQLYPLARQHYERIEPSAGEKFGIEEAGDIDAAIDVRIQDLAADAGKEVTDPEVLSSWTGWHRIEADLFSEEGSPFKFSSDEDRKASADQLNSDTDNLYKLVYGEIDAAGGGKFELSIEDVVTGASDLINEVASTKIVGEEETFSHTDLYDFQANVEGARVAYGNVKDLVTKKDQALADKIERQFSDVEKQISDQSTGETDDGVTTYKSYETIATVQKDAGRGARRQRLHRGPEELLHERQCSGQVSGRHPRHGSILLLRQGWWGGRRRASPAPLRLKVP